MKSKWWLFLFRENDIDNKHIIVGFFKNKFTHQRSEYGIIAELWAVWVQQRLDDEVLRKSGKFSAVAQMLMSAF